MKLQHWFGSLLFTTTLFSNSALARSLYLNGIDISSATAQRLSGVDLHIDEKGNVFIIAPHYQVNEEDSFVPLSKNAKQSTSNLNHKPRGKAPAELVGKLGLENPKTKGNNSGDDENLKPMSKDTED